MKKIFITGGTGCIGAAAITHLLTGDVDEVVVATRSSNPGLLERWSQGAIDDRIKLVKGDIGDANSVKSLLSEHQPTHIIHLGAFQSPDCDAYPQDGISINVGGTLTLFQAAEALTGLERFVFASSGAVYGKRSRYSGDVVQETETLAPPNLYGIWKVAGEHLARLFHEKTEVPTVCLRLNTTYGKGRDRGKTSAPTQAIKSVVQGALEGKTIPFRMPYQGRENYHFVENVGAHFAETAIQAFEGFGAFNIKGKTIAISSFLDIIKEEAEKLDMGPFVDLGIEDDAPPNLFICDLDHSAIDVAFSDLPLAPLNEGISKTLKEFHANKDWL